MPNGFKVQVVCHSDVAAIRYQTFIEQAITERLKLEQDKAVVDADLVARIAFLKAPVIISSDGTNEAASVSRVRKQAMVNCSTKTLVCKSQNLSTRDSIT